MGQKTQPAQILIDPEQQKRLEKIAQKEGRSFEEVARRVLDLGLDEYESEAKIWDHRGRILPLLKALREKQPLEISDHLNNGTGQE